MGGLIRTIRWGLLLLLAIVVLAAGALVFFRHDVAAHVITRYLAAQGVPATVEVSHVGFARAELRALEAGPLSARQIGVSYSLGGLLGGRVDGVRVEGAVLAVDLTGEAPPLGPLQALFASDAGPRDAPFDAAAAQAAIPHVLVSDTRVDLRLERGTVPVDLVAGVMPLADGTLGFQLRFSGTDALGSATGDVRGRLQALTPIEITGDILVDLPEIDTHLELVLRESGDAADALVEGEARRGHFSLNGRAGPAVAAWLPVLGEADPARMVIVVIEGEGDFSLSPPFDLATALTLDMTGTALAETLVLRLDGVLASEEDGAFGGHFSVDAEAAAPAIPGADVTSAQGRADVTVAWRGGGLHLETAPGAQLTAEGLTIAGGAAAGPVRAAVDSITVTRDADGVMRINGALTTEAMVMKGPWLGEDALEVRLAGGRVDLDLAGSENGMLGSAAVRLSPVSVPARSLEARDLALTVPLGAPNQPIATLDGGRLHCTDSPARFATLTLAGVFARDESFTLDATALDRRVRVGLRGQQSLTEGRGSVRVTIPDIRFAPDGVQLRQLFPDVTTVEGMTGTVGGMADMRWGGNGLRGSGRLNLRDVSFRSGAARVEGFTLSLFLSDLFPPASESGQTFSARRVSAGLEFANVTGAMKVAAGQGGGAGILIETLVADVLGGRLSLRDGLVEPASQNYVATAQIEEIDLARLLALLGLPELAGDGRMSGMVPVRVADGRLIVTDGLLASTGPGHLTFDSPRVRDALAGGGETVTLMLNALRNFHYESVELRLDVPPVGRARLRLRLQGSSPDVLDGYPFDINVNLESNVDPLAATISQAQSVVQLLFRDILRIVE